MNKLVSVYIPTHNRSGMLLRAVQSVLNQCYKNVEIIISDDGSSDNTADIVAGLIKDNGNVVYLKSEIPRGACHARNLALKHANGFYVTGLDDDDEFHPSRLSELVSIAENESQFSFISTGIKRIEKNGTGYSYIKARTITPEMIKNSNCVGNQVFVRTSYLNGIGGFDEDLTAWQDYDCWFRLIMKYGNAYNCAKFSYIMHTEHEAGRITTSNKVKNAVEYFINKHNKVLTKENISNIRFNYDVYYTKKSNFISLIKNPTSHNVNLYFRNKVSNAISKILNTLKSIRG